MSIAGQDIPPTEDGEPQLRDLFLFTGGNRLFGVPAEEVEGTAEAKNPAPLPHAPATILGVVYARGRMLTILDPVGLAGHSPPMRASEMSAIVSLRSDEQLALAAESVAETITISSADIESSPASDSELTAVAGILRHGGKEITILDPASLFDAAVHRKDRRRRRF
ncbi:MAG TPA: chemotaxis protein CheW [Pyrinomonadaceae bacterium]|nr:chemotaxis protein CheW [Pyrinomonadaceae bacterium]